MKLPLLFALLAAFVVSACTVFEEPPRRVRHPVARYPDEGREPAPPTQQPCNPNAAPQNGARDDTSTTPPPPPAPGGKVAKCDFPSGIPVPGKPHLVESPF